MWSTPLRQSSRAGLPSPRLALRRVPPLRMTTRPDAPACVSAPDSTMPPLSTVSVPTLAVPPAATVKPPCAKRPTTSACVLVQGVMAPSTRTAPLPLATSPMRVAPAVNAAPPETVTVAVPATPILQFAADVEACADAADGKQALRVGVEGQHHAVCRKPAAAAGAEAAVAAAADAERVGLPQAAGAFKHHRACTAVDLAKASEVGVAHQAGAGGQRVACCHRQAAGC